MAYIKKLFFAFLFLPVFFILIYFTSYFIKTSGLIFAFNLQAFYQLVFLCLLILLSSLLFVIFAGFCMDWILIMPIILLGTMAPFLFLKYPLNFVLALGIGFSLLTIYPGLENKMKTYISFSPGSIFIPSIKLLSSLLIISLSLAFYLSVNEEVKKQGLLIPDTLIDTVLTMIPQANSTQITKLPQIDQKQLELLKQNPQLLTQYGFDPKILDGLAPPYALPSPEAGASANLAKPLIKQQLQSVFQPYQNFAPPLFALLFFLTLQSFSAILQIFLTPFIWLAFFLLEKSGFIRFQLEMRQVKKLLI